jgi:hypothetical protein
MLARVTQRRWSDRSRPHSKNRPRRQRSWARAWRCCSLSPARPATDWMGQALRSDERSTPHWRAPDFPRGGTFSRGPGGAGMAVTNRRGPGGAREHERAGRPASWAPRSRRAAPTRAWRPSPRAGSARECPPRGLRGTQDLSRSPRSHPRGPPPRSLRAALRFGAHQSAAEGGLSRSAARSPGRQSPSRRVLPGRPPAHRRAGLRADRAPACE